MVKIPMLDGRFELSNIISDLNGKNNLNEVNNITVLSDCIYDVVYFPNNYNEVKTALDHISKTYANMANYAFQVMFDADFDSWAELENPNLNKFKQFMKSLVYYEGWKEENIYRISDRSKTNYLEIHNANIIAKRSNKLTDIFGIELPEQVSAFTKNRKRLVEGKKFFRHNYKDEVLSRNIVEQVPASQPVEERISPLSIFKKFTRFFDSSTKTSQNKMEM